MCPISLQVRGVIDMISTLDLNVIEVHISDVISNPKTAMRRVCLLLHIDCSEEYLHMCSEKTYASESKTRNLVSWTPELKDLVAQNIEKYEHLLRYSFDS